jgi:hypothetical protein
VLVCVRARVPVCVCVGVPVLPCLHRLLYGCVCAYVCARVPGVRALALWVSKLRCMCMGCIRTCMVPCCGCCGCGHLCSGDAMQVGLDSFDSLLQRYGLIWDSLKEVLSAERDTTEV